MASGLPKQPYMYRKPFFPDIAKKEESSHQKEIEEEHEEKPLPPKNAKKDNEIEIRVNKKKALVFLLFGIAFYSIASSIDSLPDVFANNITMTSEKASVEAYPGSMVSIPFVVENNSFFEKNINMRIESSWFSEVCMGKKCFQGGNLILGGRSKTNLSLDAKVPPQADRGEIKVYAQNKETVSLSFQIDVLSKENIFLAMRETLDAKEGKRIIVTLKNTGNKPSKVFLTLQNTSEGWKTSLSENAVELTVNEEKDISVDVSSSGSSSSFSSVLTAKTEDGFTQTLLLASDASRIYDFSVSYEPRYMVQKEGTSVGFSLKNQGNASDTYTVSLTSYPSDWSLNLSEREITLGAGEQKSVSLFVVPASERNTSVLLNVTSQNNKISKNITLNLLPQRAAQVSVLAEHFTATWCFVCPIAERAIERAAAENPSLILLNYHLKDALTTPGSDKRAQGLYAIGLNVSTVIFNGTKMVPFLSGGEDALYERYRKFFGDLISSPQTFEIYLSGLVEGDKATVSATIKPLVQKNYDVSFVVFRDPFEYKSSVRRYIVRDVLGPENVVNGGPTNLSKSFTIPADDFGNSGVGGLGVVVIIQDPVTRTVWQVAVYRFG